MSIDDSFPPMVVLVIEDDRALSRLMEAILRRSGLAVETVGRGDAGMAAIESGADRYSAIILDLMLPGLNGFEILERLEKIRPDLLSRIIVMTAVSTAVLQSLAGSPFVWRVMRKPFDLEDFTDAVLDCVQCHTGSELPETAGVSNWFERKSAVIGARAGLIAVAHGRALDLRTAFGFPDGMTDEIFPVALDRPYPITAAYRNGRPVFFASLSLARAEYPLLLSIWTSGGSQAIAALPITSEDRVIGSIGWSFDSPQSFGEDQQQTLSQISSDCFRILSHAEEGPAAPAVGPGV